MPPKTKLTLSIDKEILENAKKVAESSNIPLSRAVENFLEFFSHPTFYCFKCGKKFDATKSQICPKCGWLICPHCKGCRCGLDEKIAVPLFHLRRAYEELLSGRVK